MIGFLLGGSGYLGKFVSQFYTLNLHASLFHVIFNGGCKNVTYCNL
jgi:hypothetical protein